MTDERISIPPSTHHVHELQDGDTLGTYMGGANDLASAIQIMVTVYATVQAYSTQADRIVVVVDDTGTALAFIGRHPQQPGLPV